MRYPSKPRAKIFDVPQSSAVPWAFHLRWSDPATPEELSLKFRRVVIVVPWSAEAAMVAHIAHGSRIRQVVLAAPTREREHL